MHGTFEKIISFAGSRRGRWVVLVAWVLAMGILGPGAGKLEQVQKNDQVAWLPDQVESVKVLKKVQTAEGEKKIPTLVVYNRPSGLTRSDKGKILRDVALLSGPQKPQSLLPGKTFPIFSKDGTSALLVLNLQLTGKPKVLTGSVDQIKKVVHKNPPGLEARVTGPGGFSADAVKVFGGIDTTLLYATALLVFVLLILIYRSPVFWAIPLFSVGLAEGATRGAAYLLAKHGLTLNGQSAGIMSVLVFGAGTDYALLLVARYREELRKQESKFDAMHTALARSGPAILASAGTVILALMCLTLAQVNGTSGLGPAGAVGVFMAMVAMLTLLPALLVCFGRRAFWPFVPHYGKQGSDEEHGVWHSLGERISAHPRRVWVGTGFLLALFCLGMTQYSTGLTQGNSFRGEVESVQGQKLVAGSFPAGAASPVDVVVMRSADAPQVAARLAAQKDIIAQVQPPIMFKRLGDQVLFSAVLVKDPSSPAAFQDIQKLRNMFPRGQVMFGGSSAVEYDLRQANIRDNWLIMPLVLLVVLMVLILLLRALVIPLVLIGTVILSFFAALGVSSVVFEWVFQFPGSEPSLLLLSFIFLVALGVDYNIFLMARAREEAQLHGTREGMLRGLSVTGAVITSAGIVLAGTFAVLGVLPIVYLTQIGFIIAFGVLLDTFIVRSILVPALVFDLGPKTWWPSRLDRTSS